MEIQTLLVMKGLDFVQLVDYVLTETQQKLTHLTIMKKAHLLHNLMVYQTPLLKLLVMVDIQKLEDMFISQELYKQGELILHLVTLALF